VRSGENTESVIKEEKSGEVGNLLMFKTSKWLVRYKSCDFFGEERKASHGAHGGSEQLAVSGERWGVGS